jgi:AraC-like DNA-binding protein
MAGVVGIGDFIGWEGGCLLIGKALGVVPIHAHQAIQIVFGYAEPIRLRGRDQEEWTPYPVGIIPSRQPHAMDATMSTYNAVIFIEPESRGGRALTERYLSDGIAATDDPGVRAAAAGLFTTWLGRRGRQAVIDAAQGVLASLIGDVDPHVVTDPRILGAVDYIQANLRATITLEGVAKDAYLSPGRFRHLFVEQTGMGLRPYVLWRRFVCAWELLQAGKSVSAAAHGAGFADSAHFARTSRQTFGFPPSLLEVGRTPDPTS